jgi:hypothetical protein
MLFGRPLKKDVGPGIDEEASIGSIDRPPRVSNAIALIGYIAEFPACGKTVLQVAAHRTRSIARPIVSPAISGVSP